MDQGMKVTGSIIKLTAKEDSFMLMVTFMRETGRMIKLMAKESIFM
jgi:hypothetical protein